MPIYRISDLFDLTKTIAASLFEGHTYPWEVLPQISDYILQLGPILPADRFDKVGDDVWVAKSAKVAQNAFVGGPCIIDEEAEVRHCAFIRGSAIVGKGAVVGNSTELKNVVLFDKVQVPHFNYIGDTVMGHRAHFGAGVVTTNVKSDKGLVAVKCSDETIETGRKKVGTFAGDDAEVGCNSAMCPGCVLGRGVIVYPTSHVRGQVPHSHIFKAQDNIVPRTLG
ncbi:UDP-N-acetylglucosamine pyrophosphorylase [Clostridia bacterium OttesenSCG-928-O13]|nr:UDP-N-acetylglucosamine pyrophosphorylase [Clostridia bacterium OttesenSCG-928-O13]